MKKLLIIPQLISLLHLARADGGLIEDGNYTPTELSHIEKEKKINEEGNNEKMEDVTILRKNSFQHEIEELIWCSATKSNTVIAQTEKGELYWSNDQGDSWRSMVSWFMNESSDEPIGTKYSIVEITQSASNYDVQAFTSDTGISWISKDCGQTLNLMSYKDYKIEDFKFHPKDDNLILARARHECDKKANPSCVSYNMLLFSDDSGATFKLGDKFVYDYMWLKSVYYAYGYENQAILYTKLENTSVSQEITASKPRTDISTFQTQDLFKTPSKKLISGGWQIWYSKCCLFVEQAQADTKKPTRTLSIETYTKNSTFLEVKSNSEYVYTSVGYLDNINTFYTYMYGTRKLASGTIVSDLLKSNMNSSSFTILLKNLVVDTESNSAEFDHVNSVEGVFLANVYDNKIDFNKTNKGKFMKNISDYKTTKISFNLGSTWDYIPAPKIDSLGKPVRCANKEKCYLHLNLHTSKSVPPIYSAVNAPGIIIAVGNVGEYLSSNHYDYNTYMTNDGGVTWSEVSPGVNIYEIGDQGGLIIMAKYKQLTKIVRFSYNSGKTWQYIEFDNSNTYVSNIVIEPSNNSHQFLITGFQMEADEVTKKGAVFHLDFSEYHLRECHGHEKPDVGDSDYVKFIPHTFKDNKCLLGRTISYVVKKPDARCINPDHFQSYIVEGNCECTNDDYDCQQGFYRTNNHECVLPNNKQIDFTPPAKCNSTYTVRMGYRKNADNSCKGGVVHDDQVLPCPGSGTGFFFSLFGFLWTLIKGLLWYGTILGICGYTVFFLWSKFKGIEEKPYYGYSSGYGNINEDNAKQMQGIMDDDDDEEYEENF